MTMFLRTDHGEATRGLPHEPNVGHLKTIICGEPMYVEQCKRAIARYGHKLAQIYGQGEAPMSITVMNKAVHALASHPRYDQAARRRSGNRSRGLRFGSPGRKLIRRWQPDTPARNPRRGRRRHARILAER